MKFRTHLRSWLTLMIGLTLLSQSFQRAEASFFTLPELDTTMTDPIFKAFAAAFAFRPYEPASDLGRIFGVYAGLSTTLVEQGSTSSMLGGAGTYLPSADLQIGIGIPIGLTFHFGILPSFAVSGTTFGKYGGAIQWTATRTALSMLPFDLAVRFSYTSASLSHSQSLSGGTVDVNYSSSIIGTQFLISKNLIFVEPYLGLGFLNHSSSISGSGTVNLFGSSFPAGTQSVSASAMTPWIQAGLLLKLALFGIAAEYNNSYGHNAWGGKFSFRF